MLIPCSRLSVARRKIPKVIFHSLTLDQLLKHGETDEFIDFVMDPRFSFQAKSTEMVVEIKQYHSVRKSDLRITRNLGLYLLIQCLTWKEYFNFLVLFFKTSLLLCFRHDISQFSLKQLLKIQLEYPLWKAMENYECLTFVTTQTSMSNLPICFYLQNTKMKKWMIWYSANNRYILRKNEEGKTHPHASDLGTRIDLHLVWNESEAAWLKSNGIQQVRVVGSIVFSPRRTLNACDKAYDLVYFDITPLPKNDIFLSEKMLIANLIGLSKILENVNVQSEKALTIYLKPKRKENRIHSKTYLELRDRLAASGKIKVLNPELELYRLISSSRMVLAVPFTSPALIAHELNIPVAYFCLDVRDYKLEVQEDVIPILKSTRELTNFIENVLLDKLGD